MASRFVSCYLSKKYGTNNSGLEYERRKGKNALDENDEASVQCFLEEDINSSLAPGKKDCITKKTCQEAETIFERITLQTSQAVPEINTSTLVVCIILQDQTIAKWTRHMPMCQTCVSWYSNL